MQGVLAQWWAWLFLRFRLFTKKSLLLKIWEMVNLRFLCDQMRDGYVALALHRASLTYSIVYYFVLFYEGRQEGFSYLWKGGFPLQNRKK